MSSVLYRIALACYRNRLRTLLAWVLVLVVVGGSALLAPKQFDDGFKIPGASSQLALEQLQVTFPDAADASAILLITAPEGERMDDKGVKAEAEKYFDYLSSLPYIKGVTSPYVEQLSGQISSDGRSALARVRIVGSASEFSDANREALLAASQRIGDFLPGATANIGGDVYSIHMPKLGVTEAFSLVVAVVVLVMALGSLVGAMIPVATACAGVALGASITVIDATLATVSATTLILAVMLGLAVGIDYALFIVSRHRDQLGAGMDVEESAARAVGTAGSAVVFAGTTVIIALIGLSVANLPFLTIMGCLSAATVAFAVLLALTLLPALLGFAGERLRPKRARLAQTGADAEDGAALGSESEPAASSPAESSVPAASTPADAAWAKPKRRSAALWWATVVTKAPMLWVVLVVVGLGLLALPAANLNLALPNSGQSQPGELDRVTFDLVSQRFGVGYNGPLVLTVDIVESDDPLGVVNGLRDEIEALPGVELVSMATPNANVDTGLIQIIPTTAADDPQTTALVQTLRGKYDEWLQRYGCPTAVTGYTAIMIDVTDRLRDSMLPFGGFVVGLSFLLLMVVFRSIWVPVKAALGYLLSVGGAFGATQLVFNEGVGKWIINLQEPGPVISFLPIFGMGILFGLAMDYEVFLTSRMREEYVHGNTDDFVRAGFASASKVVVAAAFIMFGVFAFFVPATVGMVKPIAFCLAVGIGLDAFLIRMTLGPAVMALLGKRAWWLPAWLDRILPVLDVEGETLAHQMRVREALGGGGEVIIARGLGATVGERTYFEDVDVDVLPGEILCVQGAPAARRALLYGLAGRVRLSSGDAMVAGRVIGAESALVRREAMLLKPGDGFNKALRSSKAKVVLVDGLEELSAKQALTLGAAIAARQATFVLGVGPNTDVDSVVDAPHKVVRLGGAS